jgi:tetratricopeptide (TPR) repeat protein
VHTLGQVAIGDRYLSVTLLAKSELKSIPLDARVLSLSASMRADEVVVCEIPLIEFFSEDENSDRARIRKLLALAADQTDAGTHDRDNEASSYIPLKFKLLANSIEDVAIIEVMKVPHCFSTLRFTTPATMFVPIRYFGSLDMKEAEHSRCIMSSAWKANTVDVFDLESRFDDELRDWRIYDSSRFSMRDEVSDVLAAALGMKEALESARTEYQYGYGIGEAVGKEHMNQWLAMDMKLEHFIFWGSGIAHVDHADDVMLFREPTIEERAKSIAPLYQQMSYPLWHAFREGYWDTLRQEALDVLLIFDGFQVGEILGVRAVQNSTRARNSKQWDDAFDWADAARTAFETFRQMDDVAGAFYLARLELARGDIFLQSKRFEEALARYDRGREELELLKAQGISTESDIAGSLINSGIVLGELGRKPEARERLQRARMYAAQIPREDPRAQFISDVISRNLAEFDD